MSKQAVPSMSLSISGELPGGGTPIEKAATETAAGIEMHTSVVDQET